MSPLRLVSKTSGEELLGHVPFGVGDLGVELDGVDGLLAVADGGVLGVLGSGDGVEAIGELGELVTVGHPLIVVSLTGV